MGMVLVLLLFLPCSPLSCPLCHRRLNDVERGEVNERGPVLGYFRDTLQRFLRHKAKTLQNPDLFLLNIHDIVDEQ